MEFKEILYDFLIENHLTQTQFAKAIGVKQSQISEWLRGKAKPGYDILRQIVIAYNITADYWLGIVSEY